jgi:GNAT superfamily N-acetyltransferase
VVEILAADDRKTFNEFLQFPFQLYAGDKYWVPQLIRDSKELFAPENPFFQHAEVQPFIARRGNKTVGRITAIHNRAYMDFYDEKAGFFGFFDFVHDSDVAQALLNKARQWLAAKGMTFMRGPMNFSSNEEWGVLVEGFDNSPMVMMPYNFPYYAGLYEQCGLRKAKDLYAYSTDVPDVFPDKVYRVLKIAEKQGIRVRPINLRSFNEEMQIFKTIYNSAWEKNWGFMPMSDLEIEHMAKKIKSIIVPELALIAEQKGTAIGFMMFLPDVNYVLKKLNGRLFPFGIIKALWLARKIQDARLLLLGIREGFRRRGVDSVLFIEGLKGLKKHGYKRMEFSWVLEDNYNVQRVIETMQGKRYKTYRIYEAEF